MGEQDKLRDKLAGQCRKWAREAHSLCPDYFDRQRSGRGTVDRGYMMAATLRACIAAIHEVAELPGATISISTETDDDK